MVFAWSALREEQNLRRELFVMAPDECSEHLPEFQWVYAGFDGADYKGEGMDHVETNPVDPVSAHCLGDASIDHAVKGAVD